MGVGGAANARYAMLTEWHGRREGGSAGEKGKGGSSSVVQGYLLSSHQPELLRAVYAGRHTEDEDDDVLWRSLGASR